MFATDKEYEDEVRRIGRLLWPAAEFGGAAIEDGRERDGIFETEEYVHIIECTTSRLKKKAEGDLEKLLRLSRKYGARYPQKFIKGWFITLEEPTADQRSVFKKERSRIVTVSYDQFRSRLVDAKTYLLSRDNYPFGSVRDPETGVYQSSFEYITLDILDVAGNLHSVDEICSGLLEGRRFLLVGDYGAGKSATLREAYFKLSNNFKKIGSLKFPIAINLRDHHGQTDPIEALERHARRVGFSRPSDLVRAWRAGFSVLLLDGFDEIATAGWAGKTKKLKDLRHRSMELIRAFVRETPLSSGVILAGRAHFFDSIKEMETSLALNSQFVSLNVNEFNDEQVGLYLAKVGWKESIPAWIPSRPLLLGYLAAKGLLKQTLEVDAGSGPAAGWNILLDRICAREAEIEAGIDAGTVRKLIGHIATLARNSVDGLGPLSPEQITGAFSVVCGYPPDDRGMVLLQRIPGLGGHSSEDGSRVFIDNDFAEAARGGTISDYVENPYSQDLDCENWQSALARLGADVAACRFLAAGVKPGKMAAALKRANDLAKHDTLCADIVLSMLSAEAPYEGPIIFIKDVIIPELQLDNVRGSINSIRFQDCIIGRLELPAEADISTLPQFLRSYFGHIDGRTGPEDMPLGIFTDCSYDTFENPAQTTNAILGLGLPLGTKVLLTILKKLYAQKGSGRRESALYRGLDVRGKELVSEALSLLRRYGFVTKSRQGDNFVWMPSKLSDFRRRALSILAAPSSFSDELLKDSRNLGS